jgi:hypothetical protein
MITPERPSPAPSRRTVPLVVGSVAAVLLVAGIVAGIIAWQFLPLRTSPTGVPPCALASTLAPQPTAAANAAPGGGGLRVVETGFTQSMGGAGKTVSIGTVVENTSAMIAYQTRIRFRVYDGAHGTAVREDSGELLYQVIPVIMPKQRIGAGAWTNLISAVTGVVVTVASVEVELESSQWWPAENGQQLAEVTAAHVSTTLDTIDNGGGFMRFTATSPYCRPVLDRGVATVFRNSTGSIVGGNFAWPMRRGCQSGAYDDAVSALAPIPPATDDTKTVDYPYCDPGRQQTPDPRPGDPFNL